MVSMSRHEPIGGDRRLALQKLAAVGLVLWPGAALAAPLDRPLDLGVMGARKEGQQGFLNKCPEGTMRPCISSYDEAAGTYVPPLSFNPFDENGRYKKSAKTLTTSADAVEQLKAAVSACGGTIVKSNERYVYAEFADGDKVRVRIVYRSLDGLTLTSSNINDISPPHSPRAHPLLRTRWTTSSSSSRERRSTPHSSKRTKATWAISRSRSRSSISARPPATKARMTRSTASASATCAKNCRSPRAANGLTSADRCRRAIDCPHCMHHCASWTYGPAAKHPCSAPWKDSHDEA